ncbi:hypothetical protein E2R68_02305 [Psychromonas sp. RZ22]|uniref:hypothetical protein n=1 Tax=Psychromonas algarum TaxID=2555643 RepID=UPI0010681B2C|nr:hypothetical protein [Psychromonas sp. RZ22]TEW55944.1 hypothetical protein E2R68_02305 [Psychromonas sp. RZ22]
MKIEKEISGIEPSHKSIVFADKESAQKRDLNKVIGRFNQERKSILFLDDNSVGKKYQSLFRTGFSLNVNADARGNYFISNDNSINESGVFEPSETESMHYVTESCYLKKHNDSGMELYFNTDKMNYQHRVGLVAFTETGGVYTTRLDLNLESEDFEIDIVDDAHLVETGELVDVHAEIVIDSLSESVLKRLVEVLSLEDELESESEKITETASATKNTTNVSYGIVDNKVTLEQLIAGGLR